MTDQWDPGPSARGTPKQHSVRHEIRESRTQWPVLTRGICSESTDPTRSLVFGVLNVTPDSFSDGGRWSSARTAIDHGVRLYESGADVVDVGGESTRPGAKKRTSLPDELTRVLSVVEALAARAVPVSVDTMRAHVAQRAVEAGAVIVNDVSGGKADPDMLGTVAELEVPYVLMHWRSPKSLVHRNSDYTDVATEVRQDLLKQVAAAQRAGIAAEHIIIDPGLGFAKTADHNWHLLHCLPDLVATGWPVLVGASRKRFLGELLTSAGARLRDTAEREAATTAITALAAFHGAWAVRVHDARAAADAVRVSEQWVRTCAPIVRSVTCGRC